MNFAFALFRYFPFGGLQRDMLRMAECATRRGHSVTIFTTEWNGEPPADGISVRLLPVTAWSNHGRARQFEAAFLKRADGFDARFVFNRMAGGDFYFAADNCLAVEIPRKHSALMMKLNPRYRVFLRQERSVFDPAAHTKIFYITPRQKNDYMEIYHTQEDRFIYLPPGMNEKCRRPADAEAIRERKRAELGLNKDQLMLILVGSDFHRKGGDRAILALAALMQDIRRKTMLYLVGKTSFQHCSSLAKQLKISTNIIFAGGRMDVPELLLAADLMIHPARDEATGTVLIEGIAAGLPVLCSEECGFSNFVREASGLVVPKDAPQSVLNAMLADALQRLPELAERTRRYAETADFYRRADVAVDALENFCRRN